MTLFIIWFILSLLVAAYADSKGRNGAGYFFLGLILSPLISLIIALIAKDESQKVALRKGELKTCPACAELVKKEAIKCKHCGEPV